MPSLEGDSGLSRATITRHLVGWSEGDREALEALMPLVYQELRQIALGYLRLERQDHTLQASALVNEAYLRLEGQKGVHWRNRTHFFAMAAQMMRRILVDHARRQGYAKRGGGTPPLSLEEAQAVAVAPSPDLVSLDEALRELARLDEQQAQLVELRYFGGLNAQELAEVLGMSTATISRKWRVARAWLYQYLDPGDPHPA